MKFINFFFQKTALHIAIMNENDKIVQLLLQHPKIDKSIKYILTIFLFYRVIILIYNDI